MPSIDTIEVPAAKRQRIEDAGAGETLAAPRGSRIFSPFRVSEETCGVELNMLTTADGRSGFADGGTVHFNSSREDNVSGHYLGGTKPTDVRPAQRAQLDLSQSATNTGNHQCHPCISRSSFRGLGRRSFTKCARCVDLQEG